MVGNVKIEIICVLKDLLFSFLDFFQLLRDNNPRDIVRRRQFLLSKNLARLYSAFQLLFWKFIDQLKLF